MPDQVKIDPTQEFQHLSRAPIVEAALEIRARAEAPWEESVILGQLKALLPDYPTALPQREFRHEFQFGPDQASQAKYQDLGLKGFRLQSQDKVQIAHFNRDGFSFSRLRPYESWDRFSEESFRLWNIYSKLAAPTQIQRLGLRFINRIELTPQHQSLDYYLVAPPKTASELDFPCVTFFHQDTFATPGYPYIVNLVQTIQPQQAPGGAGPALIFDIDVFSEQSFGLETGILSHRLNEMRWLKNRFFFGNIAPQVLETFK